jgi:chromosome segregation ATPase
VYSVVAVEEQLAAAQKESSDLRASLRDVEVSRLEGRRELQDARRQMKQMDAERAQLAADIEELQSRLFRDEERENECRKEISALKQKVHLLIFVHVLS